jgi:hypothetical protein
MEIVEFEKAFRAATANGMMRPVLATPGLSIPIDVQMPEEFRAAAKTLAGRSTRTPKPASLLRVAAQWA